MAVLRPPRPADPRAALVAALAELGTARRPGRPGRKVARLVAQCASAGVELPAGVELWAPWRDWRQATGACPCPPSEGPLARPCASGCLAEL